MAKTNNPLWTGMRLAGGKDPDRLIVKRRNGKAFITKCPDMSNVVPSPLQLDEKSRFARAVEYAKSVIADPVQKATYKKRPGSSVYHSAIKDYLQSH